MLLLAFSHKYDLHVFYILLFCYNPLYLRYAKPWTDDVVGGSCLFFPYSPKHLQINFSKSKALQSKEINNSEGFIYVSIIASLKEAPDVVGFTQALFVAGFSIGIEQVL